MEFKLVRKDYQREYYESEFIYKGKYIKAQVNMQYHTFLHFWDVGYWIGYNKNYVTPWIIGKTNLRSRKEARNYAIEYMKNATPKDIEKLDKFYQDKILES